MSTTKREEFLREYSLFLKEKTVIPSVLTDYLEETKRTKEEIELIQAHLPMLVHHISWSSIYNYLATKHYICILKLNNDILLW